MERVRFDRRNPTVVNRLCYTAGSMFSEIWGIPRPCDNQVKTHIIPLLLWDFQSVLEGSHAD